MWLRGSRLLRRRPDRACRAFLKDLLGTLGNATDPALLHLDLGLCGSGGTIPGGFGDFERIRLFAEARDPVVLDADRLLQFDGTDCDGGIVRELGALIRLVLRRPLSKRCS